MLQTILSDELAQLRSDIIHRMEAAGKRASGNTADSLRAQLTQSPDGWQASLYGADYMETLERGRPPGNGQGGGRNDAFVSSLRQWIVARGIPYKDDEDLERLARFFQWYISTHGSRQYRAGQTLDLTTTPIRQFGERVTRRVTQAATTHLTETLLNNL